MPVWAGAEDVMRKLEERRQLVLAMLELELAEAREDAEWVHKHLDLAFEGRVDYLRG